MVTCFCNIVVAIGSVLSNSRAAAIDSLRHCYVSETLVFCLVDLVLPIVVADVVGSQKVERR